MIGVKDTRVMMVHTGADHKGHPLGAVRMRVHASQEAGELNHMVELADALSQP